MAHPISDIPEILRLIFEQIGRRFELMSLLFVSRRFFLCAIPFVWEFIDGPNKLGRLLFPNVRLKQIDDAWINNIQPLDDRSLDRYNLYAPHIKQIYHMVGWSRQELSWTAILRAVPTRPLLPNLQYLQVIDDMQVIPTIQLIGALACPTLVRIRAPGLECSNESSRSVLSPRLMTKIAETCPDIHCLELYSRPFYSRPSRHHPHDPSTLGTSPSTGPLSSLAQLHRLRTLGIGPEVLSPDILRMIGTLPSLESLRISIPYDTPRQMLPSHLPPLPDGFQALRHLSWYYESPMVTSQLWRILPFVRQLTSAFIKVEYDLTTNNEDICDLVSSVCRSSPNVTDLCFDFASDDTRAAIDLFTPAVISDLSRLQLRRIQILTSDNELLSPDEYEQLTLALSNVEYLEIQDCYFTYQGIECVAKHMQKLQFFAVSLVDWPPKEELPLEPFSSPSVLCLKAPFTTDKWANIPGGDNSDYIDSVSTALHRLWPNGAHCVFSTVAADEARDSDNDALKLINTKIKELCSPKEFSVPNMYSASQWWCYNFGDTSWFDIHRY